MYLGECFVKIPYYEYTLALRHASIRKLTVMEWSLLRIVDDYSARKDYKEYTLAHFYEEILGMDNCEMLLKPCIDQLMNFEMIEIEGYVETSIVTKIKVNEVKITEKGLKSLSDGYLLGEMQETEEKAFWDILTHAFMANVDDYSDRDVDKKAKTLAKKKTRKVEFDADLFLTAINSGHVFKEKYYSSSRWVEAAICAEEKEQWRTALLSLEQTKEGEFRVNYPLDDEVYEQINRIVRCPFGNDKYASNWDSGETNPIPDNGLVGSKIISELYSQEIRKEEEYGKLLY